MNAGVKMRWVAALRSGEYTQGKKYLKKDGKFCCLGVLCDITEGVQWDGPNAEGISYAESPAFSVTGSVVDRTFGVLPQSLSREVGLSGNIETNLTILNDEGKTFEEIADYIEKEL